MFDKIWNLHAILDDGEESLLYIDRALIHDGSSHEFANLKRDGRSVRRPAQVLAFCDHYVPTVRRGRGADSIPVVEVRNMVQQVAFNTQQHGIRLFGLDDPYQGILHVVPPEQGITQPGMLLVGADSHTSTHGAFGCLAFGIGASEMTHVLATQTLWLSKPAAMRIVITGSLGNGVTAKDLTLAVTSRIGVNGAAGHVVEYAGSTIERMSMEARMTMCNMSIEAGARAATIAPDETTYAYMHGRSCAPKGADWEKAVAFWKTLPSGVSAAFDREVAINAHDVAPMVTWGTNPEHALPITGVVPDPRKAPNEHEASEITAALSYMALEPGTRLIDVPIDHVFIGSCTNARIEDLRAAAEVARRGKIKVPSWIVPGSRSVQRQAEREGLDQVFKGAGYEWRDPGCSMCTGLNGDVLASGRRCASTSNRNFRGRQGPNVKTHLLSPPMAAAAALTGRLTDVRELLANG
jgi:3-isopropylmalate/(R)-2-methylmalate dehydratase large subunit